jgi:hypothetical protein
MVRIAPIGIPTHSVFLTIAIPLVSFLHKIDLLGWNGIVVVVPWIDSKTMPTRPLLLLGKKLMGGFPELRGGEALFLKLSL